LEPARFPELPEEYGYKKYIESFATKCLDQVKIAAQAQDVSCAVMYVEHEHPYLAIIDTTNNQHCDLIVMASHGRHGIAAIVSDRKGPHSQHDPRSRLSLEIISFTPQAQNDVGASAPTADSAGAGAPANEIEITLEMIEAGARAVQAALPEYEVGHSQSLIVAKDVLRAALAGLVKV
jgi:hypothetical protein